MSVIYEFPDIVIRLEEVSVLKRYRGKNEWYILFVLKGGSGGENRIYKTEEERDAEYDKIVKIMKDKTQ